MADLPGSNEDTDSNPDRESATGTPHWVIVFGIIALVVVLLIIAVMLTGGGPGGGGHGPARH